MQVIKKIPLKEYWSLLSPYFKPMKWRFMLLGIILLCFIGLQVLNPFILRFFVDNVTSGQVTKSVYLAAILFMVVALLQQGLNLLVIYLGEILGWKATNELRLKLVKHYLSLDMKHHKSFTPGEMIERADTDINTLQNFFSHFVVSLVGNLFLIACILSILFWQDWRIGLLLIGFTIFALLVIEKVRGVAVPYWQQVREVNGNFMGFIRESVNGIEDIRSNGGVRFTMNRLINIFEKWLPALKKANLSSYYMWMATIIVFSIGTAISFGMGAYLYSHGIITIGTVFMIFQFTELLVNPIEKIKDQIEDLQKADASIKRIDEILNLKSDLIKTGKKEFPSGSVSITYENVAFGYGENKIVLDNLNFQLEKNKILGLLGRTGSGKTTLTRLLLRFYDSDNGIIKLGETNIVDIPLSELRKKIGVVTQEVQLFKTSLRNNLTLFDSSISDQEIKSIIEEIGIKDWYDTLENGLDTELLNESSGLSAGQAQLIALVRIFLKDPSIVILDEASSRLDPATENMIQTAVKKLLQNRTAIIIAHHLATVKFADEIMILEDGKILEYDKRNLLEKDKSSEFYKLLRIGNEELLE
ncbi:ABC transporter ATP-binding protein [Paenibacillus sp. KACC 21273]|uniref:ABC transporter ATP-binding protein n=1 Tax=Paenibacillus sp. KACC 21273 TaxID=3025665 RepID=UPI0023670307|nr:ABC transporter ATP-binding protein [Paenibacillus sp. KACC 21273]WDF52841.1 ABC transporter ATP-binding protein [Paenibacillus sp. KACC 21273]